MRLSNYFAAIVATVIFLVVAAFAQSDAGPSTPAAPAAEKTKQLKPQIDCPVMGGKINKNIYADFEGRKVYFCCKGCIPEFNKDPAKYMKKLEEIGQTPETLSALKLQTTCPVMAGQPIDKSLYVDYKGKRIYVCCEDCFAKLKKNPEKYLKKLEKTGQEAETIKNGPEQTEKKSSPGK
jgi:YHS domain-containing protein